MWVGGWFAWVAIRRRHSASRTPAPGSASPSLAGEPVWHRHARHRRARARLVVRALRAATLFEGHYGTPPRSLAGQGLPVGMALGGPYGDREKALLGGEFARAPADRAPHPRSTRRAVASQARDGGWALLTGVDLPQQFLPILTRTASLLGSCGRTGRLPWQPLGVAGAVGVGPDDWLQNFQLGAVVQVAQLKSEGARSWRQWCQ